MDTAMQRERLTEIFDHVVRDITQREAGIVLHSSQTQLEGELCTVYTTFDKGYHTSLSLCAEKSMFVRLTRRMMEKEDVTSREVELFAKEFFNVLCGNVDTQLYQITKVPARFHVPAFCQGRYMPENHLPHIVLTYSSDENESAQLIHHALTANGGGLLGQSEQKEGAAL